MLPIAGPIALLTAAAGASVPFATYEAESAVSDGVRLGPDRHFGTLASEASGRQAIRLDRGGQYVAFTLKEAANALTLRYSIPDGPAGRGADSALQVTSGGKQLAIAPLTSRFGWFYGRYPFSNRPSEGRAHHFFDEVRVRLGRTLPAGSQVVFRRPLNQPIAWIAVDCVDFELVAAPALRPPHSIAVARLGADPTGHRDATSAFLNGIKAAQRTGHALWIGPGTYLVNGHLPVDRVRLIGAGTWHSILTGRGIGVFARKAPRGSRDVELSGFTIEGQVTERNDHAPLSAIGGAFNDSLLSDLYLHHTKVGAWLDGPMHNLVIRRLRISDQTADGINLHRGARRVTIEQNYIRNSGDDGIALWSHHEPDADVVIRNNTVIAPILANGVAVYGGRNISIIGNLVADTLTEGGGIHLGTRFHSTPFEGSITIERNRLIRTGSLDPNWHYGIGAIWLYALERPIEGARITLRSNRVDNSSCEAVQLLGPKPISGIILDQLDVERSNDAPLALQAPGALEVRGLRFVSPDEKQIPVPENFRLIAGGGSSGWEARRVGAAIPPSCSGLEAG
jgi:hypothetical protein